jgi:hypothetical protein
MQHNQYEIIFVCQSVQTSFFLGADIQSDTTDGSLAAGAQVLDQTFTSNPLLIAVVMGTVVTAVLLVVVTTVLCCRFCRPKRLIVAGRDAIIAAGTKPHSFVAPANFEIDIDKLPSNAIYCQKAESTGDSNLKVSSLGCLYSTWTVWIFSCPTMLRHLLPSDIRVHLNL